jgi:hypothetical protein
MLGNRSTIILTTYQAGLRTLSAEPLPAFNLLFNFVWPDTEKLLDIPRRFAPQKACHFPESSLEEGIWSFDGTVTKIPRGGEKIQAWQASLVGLQEAPAFQTRCKERMLETDSVFGLARTGDRHWASWVFLRCNNTKLICRAIYHNQIGEEIHNIPIDLTQTAQDLRASHKSNPQRKFPPSNICLGQVPRFLGCHLSSLGRRMP